MSEANKKPAGAGSDEPKSGRVRKTVEVTSTRYTEIVEPQGHSSGNPMVPKSESPDPDLFTASFVRVDNGIEGFHDTVGRDQRKFQDTCLEMVQPYEARMKQMLAEVRKTEASAKIAKLEKDREADKKFIKESLREVLEGSRERQLQREQQLGELLKQF